MRFIKRSDDTKGRCDVMGEIASEMKSLQKKLEEGVNSEKENIETVQRILSELKDGNETMKKVLAMLEEIAEDMKQLNKPWYSRAFCR